MQESPDSEAGWRHGRRQKNSCASSWVRRQPRPLRAHYGRGHVVAVSIAADGKTGAMHRSELRNRLRRQERRLPGAYQMLPPTSIVEKNPADVAALVVAPLYAEGTLESDAYRASRQNRRKHHAAPLCARRGERQVCPPTSTAAPRSACCWTSSVAMSNWVATWPCISRRRSRSRWMLRAFRCRVARQRASRGDREGPRSLASRKRCLRKSPKVPFRSSSRK